MTIAGTGMSAKSYGKIIGANDRLNVALVGLGRRFNNRGVAESLAQKESNVQLLYLCDVMESQREKAAGRFSNLIDYAPALENDVRGIYNDRRVDVVSGKYHFPDDGWTMYDTIDATFLFPGNKIIKCDSKSRNRYNTYGSLNGTIIFGSEGTVLIAGSGYKLCSPGGSP